MCAGWAASGECQANPGWMLENCALSCGECGSPQPPQPNPTPTPVNPTPAPTPACNGCTPVEQHGKLSVVGNNIVGSHGNTVQLRGMSFFWSQWQGQYYTQAVVNWLVDDWKCSLVRAVLGIHESSGYLQDPGTEKAKIELVVNAAIAKGIYVLIDWHDHHAEWHINEAKGFVTEIGVSIPTKQPGIRSRARTWRTLSISTHSLT